MARRAPRHARPSESNLRGGVEGNSRLTSTVAAVLLVLLFLEGLTIAQIGTLLTPHVFIGALLIPVVIFKIGSTGWRFVKYYAGSDAYRKKGPPQLLLRLLGPFVVILTVVVFASGVGLVYLGTSYRQTLLLIHKASFILWFGAMAIHVLGHLVETATLAPRDWFGRYRRDVDGASLRQWALVASLVIGILVALVMTPHAYNWWTRQ